MNVIMLNGSFRKQNSYGLLVQISQILRGHGVDSEIINLFDYRINACIGDDDNCIKTGSCAQNDDMPALRQKLLDCDGIILSSPVYLGNVTSTFKAFADRTNEWFHKPRPAGKPVLFVATTAVSGIKDTLHFFDVLTTGWGARKGGSIVRAKKNMDMPVQEKEVSRFRSLLENDKKYYRPGMNDIVIYNVQKVMALKSDGDDHRFWEEKGWFGKPYYYDCRMSPGKKAFSKMMSRILAKAMK